MARSKCFCSTLLVSFSRPFNGQAEPIAADTTAITDFEHWQDNVRKPALDILTCQFLSPSEIIMEAMLTRERCLQLSWTTRKRYQIRRACRRRLQGILPPLKLPRKSIRAPFPPNHADPARRDCRPEALAKRSCLTCSRDPARPFMVEEREWDNHLRTRSHRMALKRAARADERQKYLEQRAARSAVATEEGQEEAGPPLS